MNRKVSTSVAIIVNCHLWTLHNDYFDYLQGYVRLNMMLILINAKMYPKKYSPKMNLKSKEGNIGGKFGG